MEDLPDNFTDRPDAFMGESGSTYLQKPRRNSGTMVTEKLSALNKQNETCQAGNDASKVRRHSEYPKTAKKLDSGSIISDKTESTQSTVDTQKSPTLANRQKVSLQREDAKFMAERPGDWLNGGEGEEAIVESYMQSPKTKLRSSWLKSSGDTSQSLRDLTALPLADDKHDKLHASESKLSSEPVQRRKTSSKVMEKLSALNQQNEENHHKNEGLAVHKGTKSAKPPRPKAKKADQKGGEKGQSTPASSKEKVKFQQNEHLYMAERPTTWNGGEGEEVAHSYLQKPKTKLKDSWLKDGSGTGMSQSMRDLSTDGKQNDDMNASDSQLFSARRRQTSPMVMEKLLDLNKQNEENHKKNEEIDPWVASIGKSPPAKVWKPPKKADGAHEEAKTDQVSPKASSKDKVKFQKDENLYMAERPTTWNGGEGEEVALSYLQKPKTKLKDSWLKGGSGSGMSQSMRDLSTDEKHNDDMNASDTQLFSARRRKTSPMVMEKLLDLNKQNEENHKKNEELDPGAVSVEATKVWKPVKQSNTADDEEQGAQDESGGQSYTPNNQEKIKLQREDVAHLVARPVAWMGGEGEEAQPYSLTHASPKAKLKDSWQKSDASGGKMEGLKIDSLVDS